MPDPSRDVSARRGWGVSILAALLPIALAAALLVDRWQQIPDRFPTHWEISGQPNGWSNRTPAGVFGPLVIGVCVILLLALIGELIPRTTADFPGSNATLGITRNILRGVAWLIGCLFAFGGMLPLASDPTRFVPLMIIGPVVFAIILIAWVATRAVKLSREAPFTQDPASDRYWKAGIFYCNPGDPAVLVPKRMGIGYTFNFGHPISWVMLIALILLPIIIPLLVHLGKH